MLTKLVFLLAVAVVASIGTEDQVSSGPVCESTYYGDQGAIWIKNYPNGYSVPAHCSSNIIFSQSYNGITFEFDHLFGLEAPFDSITIITKAENCQGNAENFKFDGSYAPAPFTLGYSCSQVEIQLNCDSGFPMVIYMAGFRFSYYINDCIDNPCRNAGTCLDGINEFTCTCAPGWTGPTCEINIDECLPGPCRNGGSCVDGINEFTCTCAPKWTGPTCELDNSCTIGPLDRIDCGFPGITKSQCLAKECCFDNSERKTIWCFKPRN